VTTFGDARDRVLLNASDAYLLGLRRMYDDMAAHREWLLRQVDYCNSTLVEIAQKIAAAS
jgi:hypothetical protein